MIVIVMVGGIAWLVGDSDNFSPVELFLSSREPFALPPPHLKNENRIITLQYQYIVKYTTFSCSCPSFIREAVKNVVADFAR